jgi:hypothetical protein
VILSLSNIKSFLGDFKVGTSGGLFLIMFLDVQFHNVVGGFSPPFERSGGVAGTELEGRA